MDQRQSQNQHCALHLGMDEGVPRANHTRAGSMMTSLMCTPARETVLCKALVECGDRSRSRQGSGSLPRLHKNGLHGVIKQ